MIRIAALTVLLLSGAAETRTIHVHAGRLIDPERGEVLTNRRIDVVDGKVTAVVAWSPPDDGAEVVDWSAFTVLPGLIDSHTHIADGYESTADPAVPLKHSAAEAVLRGARQARVTLEAGFTTVRDVGVYRALTDVALRDAIAVGDVPGPRMVVAGGYITIPGGGGAVTGMAPDVPLPADTTAGYVRTPDEARAAADYFLSHGADFLKLIATGAVLALGSAPNALELTPEQMKAACDRAAKRGSYCIAHAHSSEGIKAAIRAGARSIEHASLADDEALALAKAKGVWLDMDVYNGTWFEEVGRKQGWPEEYLRKGRETTDTQRAAFAKAVKLGVKLSFGTDAGVYPHGLNARQFAVMVKYGMTPMQAIQSATTVSAALLGKSGEVGALSPGHWGDMIAVAGDPLADVRALETVAHVMKGGEVIR
jgi:imidazolonepropionase-like amidohydrolase